MPYFRKVNLLVIHIPKTGGTSLETYLSEKYNTPLNPDALFGNLDPIIQLRHGLHVTHSLQHLTLQETKHPYFKIKQPFVFTIVRNPYERLMSELFYQRKITVDSTPEKVYEVIRWIVSKNIDNHTRPQYQFIDGNVTILRTETLEEDMHQLGFTDFHLKENENLHKVNYYDYLNKDSIRFINHFYQTDFKIFGYTVR